MTRKRPDSPVALVVDDEPMLRFMASAIAEDAGLVPCEASNADEALLLLEHQDNVCVIFTDIQMPGTMDGLNLAKIVHRRWPKILIIITSGRVQPATDSMPRGAQFLAKPCSPDNILSVFREASALARACA